MKYAESHKNATYLSPKTVTQFIEYISNYMFEEIVNEVKECDNFSILMDECTDEANRSELSVFTWLVKNGKIKNHFMELIYLPRCSAESIFEAVTKFFDKHGIDISDIRFAAMDGCATMAGVHNGVQALLGRCIAHFIYIHCRNHQT